MAYRIHLAKEDFKFAATHFTIFGPGKSERLHGHNYYVGLDLWVHKTDPRLGLAVDFNQLKPLIRESCAQLDERVLIPRNSPHLQVNETDSQVNVDFGSKKYSFPKEDVLLLEAVNLTSEELARYLAEELVEKIKKKLDFQKLSLTVQESRGQSVSFSIRRPCLTTK